MNARILKKLSKKVHAITGNRYGKVWVYHDEPFADEFLRERHRWSSRITHIPVVGGELDYWGEATDFHPLFDCAANEVFWSFTTFKDEPVFNASGEVIDTYREPQAYPGRLTGKEVIQKLNLILNREVAA